MEAKKEVVLQVSKVSALMSLPLILIGTFVFLLCGYKLISLNYKDLLQWGGVEFYDCLIPLVIFLGGVLVVGGFNIYCYGPLYSYVRGRLLLRKKTKLCAEGIFVGTGESRELLHRWNEILSIEKQRSWCPGVESVTRLSFVDGTELMIPGNIKGYGYVVSFIRYIHEEGPRSIETEFDKLLTNISRCRF